MEFDKLIAPFSQQPLTKQILTGILKEYRWPQNKIAALVKQGLLTPVKKGLYITGPALKLPQPSLFLLANYLYGPSYVSVEAALSFHGMIPEKVASISSLTTGHSKIFQTSLARFRYIHAPIPYYSFGIQQRSITEKETVLMASKEKALCDKIVTTKGLLLRSVQQTLNFLVEDMRIEKQTLRELNIQIMNSWLKQAPKKQSLSILIKTLETL